MEEITQKQMQVAVLLVIGWSGAMGIVALTFFHDDLFGVLNSIIYWFAGLLKDFPIWYL